jgi:glutamine synthetase
MVRELTRAVAARQGHRAILSPMTESRGTGNGTHIHFSLLDHEGNAAMHDDQRLYGLSTIGEQFVAGVLEHIPILTAITTPSVCSFYRLTPNRLAPTWANVSYSDRAASLRVCGGSASDPQTAARQFNVEYRVADATASPYMALGALVHAGVDGIRKNMALPKPTERPFSEMRDVERGAAGMRVLPNTLRSALVLLSASPVAVGWFGQSFLDLYVNFKSEEEQMMTGLDAQAICNRYAEIY